MILIKKECVQKICYILFTLFFTYTANAQMVLEYEVSALNAQLALPLDNDAVVTVDWGGWFTC